MRDSARTDLQEIENGLAAVTKYDRDRRKEETAGLAELKRSLGAIGPELERRSTQYETHLKATKGRFNVFTVIRKATDERDLHTPWLAYLLDPEEKHDCGDLFLRTFIKTLAGGAVEHDGNKKLPVLPDPTNSAYKGKAEVESELGFDHGRFDIWIKLPGWGGIVIENKIGAGEQPDQLARYYSFLKKTYPGSGVSQNRLLLYLTPDGANSATANGCPYYPISYRVHILAWLEECLRETYQWANINQALQQYRQVVQQITGDMTMETAYLVQIESLVMKQPAIIRHRALIAQAIDSLCAKYWDEFIRSLWDGIGRNRPDARPHGFIEYRKGYPNVALGGTPSGLKAAGYELRIEFGGLDSPDTPFYIGVTAVGCNKPFPTPIDQQLQQFLNRLKGRLPSELKEYPVWRGLFGLPCPDLSDEGLAKIIGGDAEPVTKTAADASQEILRYINEAEQAWADSTKP